MKIIKKTFQPIEIDYNGDTYYPKEIVSSQTILELRKRNKELRKQGIKSIVVSSIKECEVGRRRPTLILFTN